MPYYSKLYLREIKSKIEYMINDSFKNTFDFELRFATKNEIEILIEFLVKQNWEDSQKYRTSPVSDDDKKEALNFVAKEKDLIRQLIGGKVMVQEYKKFNILIFVYNYIQEQEKNTITSATFRALKTENGFEKLDHEDVVFKLDALKNNPYQTKRNKKGRPNRPNKESVQKAIEVNRYLKANPNVNREHICKEFGFSKTTYYRTLKWLEYRRN